MSVAERIRELPVLSHLDDDQISELAAHITTVEHPRGHRLLNEGERTCDAYLIDSGQVLIQRDTPYGHYTLSHLEAGAFFGETSFIDANGRSGDAVIGRDSRLLQLSPAALEPLFERQQKLRIAVHWAIWKSLSQKLRDTNQRLAGFFSSNLPPLSPDLADPRQSGEFHIDLNAKRDLFREQRLSSMEINFLSTLSKEKRLKSGQVIFREGEPGEALYVILEGRVIITKMISGAGEEALAILERGDYFGEMALIDRQPRSANATAHEGGAVVLKISNDVLSGILDIQKFSSFRLLQLLCGLVAKRLREVDDKLISWYIFASGSGQSLELPSS